ncbi:MAG: HAD hydrolase-like protein [Bacteroidales bacterium]|nr:HAD hydrolase-like protein [Bacteroidales bacterium]
MKYKHIIWDYNGTLLDDVGLCTEIINEMLKARNLPEMTVDTYRKLFDFPVKNYYERIGFNFADESFEKVGTEFIIQYDLRSKNTKLHDGIPELLKGINEAEIKQSILSARKKEQLDEELEKFGISYYFENIFGLNDHYAGGKTEIGRQLIEKIGLTSDEILLIGDTTHDCDVAKTLDIKALAVSYGHHPKEKFKRCNIEVRDTIKEVREFIFS